MFITPGVDEQAKQKLFKSWSKNKLKNNFPGFQALTYIVCYCLTSSSFISSLDCGCLLVQYTARLLDTCTLSTVLSSHVIVGLISCTSHPAMTVR